MGTLGDWENVREEPLGSGGQGTVFLVRTPERRTLREKSFDIIKVLSGQGLYKHTGTALAFAQATLDIAREEQPSELGALKKFHPPAVGLEAEEQAAGRMRNEIAVLEQKRPGLLKIMDHNEAEGWIVTEYCPEGTLERHLPRYKGNVKLALAAFLSLVKTVVELHFHKEPIIHRDIKPQNIFVGDAGQLLLGDFGIVFQPNQAERLSFTGESVGPRDFMPPWVFLDERPTISPKFDVYMLGKVLWCMVAGRLKLHREDFLDERFDVTKLFPDDPDMHLVNRVLEKTVVAREKDCIGSQELLAIVIALSEMVQRGGRVFSKGVTMRCRVCQLGYYQLARPDASVSWALNHFVDNVDRHLGVLRMAPYICDRCGHVQVFRS